jgi:hypothetical protein
MTVPTIIYCSQCHVPVEMPIGDDNRTDIEPLRKHIAEQHEGRLKLT